MNAMLPGEIAAGLDSGKLVPFLGPGMLALVPGGSPVPATPEALAAMLTAKVAVPHKIRTRLTAAAQFIENFKHRKTLVSLMSESFAPQVTPSSLLRHLAGLPRLPLVVDLWYDSASQLALQTRPSWGQVQGLSQSEHFGDWFGCYDSAGAASTTEAATGWQTLLYKPIGGIVPARNFLVSDTDYVEVLTEIDIQTPIPLRVQELRSGRGFLFLGCRFNDQLQRSFARQIMKRSGGPHWAVLPGEATRNEARFLAEQGIRRLELTLEQFQQALTGEELAAA